MKTPFEERVLRLGALLLMVFTIILSAFQETRQLFSHLGLAAIILTICFAVIEIRALTRRDD